MDDSRLLQESNLAARQPQSATSIIQAITGEGLVQGPYMAARGGVEPTTFRTEGADNLCAFAPAGPLLWNCLPAKICALAVWLYSLPS